MTTQLSKMVYFPKEDNSFNGQNHPRDVRGLPVSIDSVVATKDGFVKVHSFARVGVSNGGFMVALAEYVGEKDAIAAGYSGEAMIVSVRPTKNA